MTRRLVNALDKQTVDIPDDVVERAWEFLMTPGMSNDDAMRAAGRVFVEWERNRIADYLEGKDGKIPGVSCYARLISRNNQPCMSGDPRDRLNKFDRRDFDEATASLADEIRSLKNKQYDPDDCNPSDYT